MVACGVTVCVVGKKVDVAGILVEKVVFVVVVNILVAFDSGGDAVVEMWWCG